MVLDARDRRADGPRAVPDHRRPRRRRRGGRGRPRRHHASSPATTSSSASSRPAAAARRAPAAASTCATSAPSCSPAARSPTSPPATTAKDGTRPRHHVLHRHLLAVHGRERGHLHQDRRRHPARQGRPRRLRRHHRLGLRPSTPPTSQPGETVVVVGIGGIGINAVQGAAMAGARHVVAVDPVEFEARAGPHCSAPPTPRPSIEEAAGARRPRSPGAPTPTRRSSPPAWPPAT